MKDKKQTIFVGVSGGVDSSVAAALLKEAGHDVVGVFIRTWQPEWMTCTWRDERQDAMRVCAHLGIPFLECDLTDAYRDDVAGYMISEYRAGRTPNPDVMCNKYVKFGAFLDWALEKGADKVATGHYARLKVEEKKSGDGSSGRTYVLQRGVDTEKDQSYFLWTLTQDQLRHIVLPIGEMNKSETRTHAERFGLPTATKKDSQGICFLGQIPMKEFLSHYIDEQPGKLLDTGGEVIGHHPGALFFTHGERHGFTITAKTSDDTAQYVVSKDIVANTLTVAPQSFLDQQKSAGEGAENTVILSGVNDAIGVFKPGYQCECQLRYHGEVHETRLVDYDPAQQVAEVVVQPWDPTIAPGQSVVLYQGEACLGGGIVQ